MSESRRIEYYDKLNVISCFAVVLLHANGFVHAFIKDDWWWLRVLIEDVCYFGVPVFFMLSGATLLNYREKYSTRTFYKKRFLKALIPFLIWSTVFYVFNCVGLHAPFEIRQLIDDITTGHIPLTNYWFFIPLFGLYIFMPYLSSMVMNISKRMLLCLCVLLISLQTIFPFIYSFIDVPFKPSFPIAGYAFYLFLGYYISRFFNKSNKKILYIFGLLCVASLLYRYVSVFSSDSRDPFMFSYMGIYAVFPAIFIFMLAKTSESYNGRANAFWSWMAKKSFGIYLLHMFFIRMLAFVWNNQNPWYILVAFVLAYSASLLITALMQRVKYLKFLVP